MHDDGEFAGQRHRGFLHPCPLGDPHRPALQGGAAFERAGEDEVTGPVEHRTHRAVPVLSNPAAVVGFAGLISRCCHAERRPCGFDDLNREGSSIARVSATMTPTPGVVISSHVRVSVHVDRPQPLLEVIHVTSEHRAQRKQRVTSGLACPATSSLIRPS
jgi:hypothetical protein